ncbi:MAG: glycosyltransferase family 2 protein, partial [Desulfovibrionaceae bacterium]
MNNTISPNTSAVILVNYNNARDTLECLRSLGELARPARHVVIVDNHSKDNSVQELRDYLSQLKVAYILNKDEDCGAISAPYMLLLCKHNYGFSGGNNAALRLLMQKTDCNAFWLLNNDTIVDPKALEHLCARLNETAEAGACGSTLVFQKRDDTVQCAAGSSLRKYFGTTRFVCGGASMADVEKMSTAAVEKELDEILGASLFVRRAAVEQCGLMDERYFLYREDSEWCTRFRKFGFTLAWARNSIVRHKEGGTTGA